MDMAELWLVDTYIRWMGMEHQEILGIWLERGVLDIWYSYYVKLV